MSEQIKYISSDVWGFQELWHNKAIEELFKKARLQNNYTILSPNKHTGQSIICAGAVRKDILVGKPMWIEKFPKNYILQSKGDDDQTSDISVNINSFSRPVLKFNIRPRKNGKIISVFVIHFKSKSPEKIYNEKWYRSNKTFYSKHNTTLGSAISTIRRTAEAGALRMLLTEEMKGNNNPVVVLGDLNDSQHSNTLNIVTGQPNYLLSGLSKGGSDTALYTTGTLQEYRSMRDVYYTHVFKNTRQSLDHILVSQEFYDNSRNRIWAFNGLEVFNDHLNREDHKITGTNDHGIIKASFEYRPA